MTPEVKDMLERRVREGMPEHEKAALKRLEAMDEKAGAGGSDGFCGGVFCEEQGDS
jgi:hypothetical protein